MSPSHSSTGLVLLAHGSRDHAWLETFEQLTTPARAERDDVILGYMELAEPSLADAVNQLAARGFQVIEVLPLFLAAGKHLRVDVPAMIDELVAATGLSITLLPPVGEHPRLRQAIVDILAEQRVLRGGAP